jgi:mitotic spindle assembly checkpoint protein MAD1
MEKSLKTHQSIVLKLQKKMKLVMNERESQRLLLESYEKDLTVNPGGAASSNAQETQTRIRMEMLTNSLIGYKELCARLEQENADLRGNPSLATDSTTFGSSEQFRSLRKELDSLRMDNDKLRKRNHELEIEIENLTLRNNCVGDDERLKVLHFKNNPASIAQEQAAEEVTKLKAEVERLKSRNKKLEEGNEDLTARINETMNMTLGVKELQKVKEEYTRLQAKFHENEKVFTKVNQDLREVVYMLFGYKLDRYGNNNYR